MSAVVTTEAPIEGFTSAVADHARTGARFSYLAIRANDILENLVCRIVFAPSRPEHYWDTNFGIGPLALRRGWIDSDGARRLLTELTGRILSLGDARLTLQRRDGSPYSWSFNEYSPLARKTIHWPSHQLLGTGDGQRELAGSEVLAGLETRLLTWSRGQLGSVAQLRRFLGAPGSPLPLDWQTLAHCEVLAPTYLKIRAAHLRLSDGQLDVTVESLQPVPSGGFRLYVVHDLMTKPLAFEADQFQQVAENRRQLARTIPRLEGPYELHLVVGDFSIDVRRVGVPKLSSQLHALIDVDGKWLGGLLSATKGHRGADGFLHYVSTLLQLCGIPAVSYDFKSPENAPDLVAEIDEETILVGECKVVAPTTEMLETLRARAYSLAHSIQGPKSLTVLPVFFFATPQHSLSQDAARFADERGVRLLGSESLLHLQSFWERGEPQEILRERLLRTREAS